TPKAAARRGYARRRVPTAAPRSSRRSTSTSVRRCWGVSGSRWAMLRSGPRGCARTKGCSRCTSPGMALACRGRRLPVWSHGSPAAAAAPASRSWPCTRTRRTWPGPRSSTARRDCAVRLPRDNVSPTRRSPRNADLPLDFIGRRPAERPGVVMPQLRFASLLAATLLLSFATACQREPEPAAAPAEAASPAAERIEADVRQLADDSMEGRETGTRGYELASDYVAERFAE